MFQLAQCGIQSHSGPHLGKVGAIQFRFVCQPHCGIRIIGVEHRHSSSLRNPKSHMTSKNRRQRGSRTHGGGTHKNRRGAGHRGGRGNAGRSKHEFHNHEPLGKSGFKRPEQSKIDVHTVNIERIDEILYEIEIGLKEINELDGVKKVTGEPPIEAYEELDHTGSSGSIDEIYIVDITALDEDAKEADVSKLLGGGEIRNPVIIRTDQCSRSAKQSVKSKGGTVSYTTNGDGFKNKSRIEKAISRWDLKLEIINNSVEVNNLEEYLEQTESGEPLRFEDFNEVVEVGLSTEDHELAYEVMEMHASNVSQVDGLEAINLMRARDFAREFGLDPSPFKEKIETYFEQADMPDSFKQHMAEDLPSEMSVMDVLTGLDGIHDFYDFDAYEDNPELRSERVRDDEVEYLMAVDEVVNWV